MGDEFELREYERRNPLNIEGRALGDYANVTAGDCIVTFSRNRIFQIKGEIEAKTGLKCCVIYGSLPPETRSQQARMFNERDNGMFWCRLKFTRSGYDVLVASDAVGMGLNLNIRRVIVDTITKFDNGGIVDVSPSMVHLNHHLSRS